MQEDKDKGSTSKEAATDEINTFSDEELDESSSSANLTSQDSKLSPTNATHTSEEDNMDFDDTDDDEELSEDHMGARRRGERGDVRRSHHNVLERKRRDLIKDSFARLRDSVPVLASEKASRAQILKRAADFIQSTHQRNETLRADLDELVSKNAELAKLKADKLVSSPNHGDQDDDNSKAGCSSSMTKTASTSASSKTKARKTKISTSETKSNVACDSIIKDDPTLNTADIKVEAMAESDPAEKEPEIEHAEVQVDTQRETEESPI